MKKHNLLSTLILTFFVFISIQAYAFEQKNEVMKYIFSDPELSRLLDVRPFGDEQAKKAAPRLSEVFTEFLKKHESDHVAAKDIPELAECLATFTILQVTSTQAFEMKLAKPEQLISDLAHSLNLNICNKMKSKASGSQKVSAMSVNDLLLDFSSYYGKEVLVKGYITYNDMGSYLFHSKGNMNAVFINNNRLSRDSKKYLMGCDKGCEVTLKVMPSAEESILMKTAFALSVVK
jgi:hypothetical protein